MTQAAVSYQIKLLEERIGAPLFVRQPRAVSLTPTGQLLAPATSEALDLLNSAFSAAKVSAGGVLSVSIIPTFAANWLAPKVGAFQMLHPDIAVRMNATRALADLSREDMDVVIRSGLGNWPGLMGHRLILVEFTPMLSPKLIERLGPPRHPADLLRFPLIDPHDPWWTAWFRQAGVSGYDSAARPNLQMGDQHLEARAAMGGSRVVILTPAFYRQEIAEGRLMQPFHLVADEDRGYWLCYAKARRNLPKIRAFRD